jgi:hypothetical protein
VQFFEFCYYYHYYQQLLHFAPVMFVWALSLLFQESHHWLDFYVLGFLLKKTVYGEKSLLVAPAASLLTDCPSWPW